MGQSTKFYLLNKVKMLTNGNQTYLTCSKCCFRVIKSLKILPVVENSLGMTNLTVFYVLKVKISGSFSAQWYQDIIGTMGKIISEYKISPSKFYIFTS
jgi:hypothetical protein